MDVLYYIIIGTPLSALSVTVESRDYIILSTIYNDWTIGILEIEFQNYKTNKYYLLKTFLYNFIVIRI